MTEEEVNENLASDEDDSPTEKEEEMVTVWSPEAADNIEINSTPIDEWVRGMDFSSTEQVPIPERLVDQVIVKMPALSSSVKRLNREGT